MILLVNDLSDDVTGAVPAFWIGVGLMATGFLLATIQFRNAGGTRAQNSNSERRPGNRP